MTSPKSPCSWPRSRPTSSCSKPSSCPISSSTSAAVKAGESTVPDQPRVRTVASVGGVSLERGVPVAELDGYLHDSDNIVWMDVQNPGPSELAMLVEEFGFHPIALEGAAQEPRRPKVDEYKGY